MSICLLVGGAVLRLAATSVMLTWTGAADGAKWEEDVTAQSGQLAVGEVRVADSAGLVAPEGAVRDGAVWRLRPSLPPLPSIELDPEAGGTDWSICADGACTPLAVLAAGEPGPATLTVCDD